jgi:hypothetical protein
MGFGRAASSEPRARYVSSFVENTRLSSFSRHASSHYELAHEVNDGDIRLGHPKRVRLLNNPPFASQRSESLIPAQRSGRATGRYWPPSPYTSPLSPHQRLEGHVGLVTHPPETGQHLREPSPGRAPSASPRPHAASFHSPVHLRNPSDFAQQGRWENPMPSPGPASQPIAVSRMQHSTVSPRSDSGQQPAARRQTSHPPASPSVAPVASKALAAPPCQPIQRASTPRPASQPAQQRRDPATIPTLSATAPTHSTTTPIRRPTSTSTPIKPTPAGSFQLIAKEQPSRPNSAMGKLPPPASSLPFAAAKPLNTVTNLPRTANGSQVWRLPPSGAVRALL